MQLEDDLKMRDDFTIEVKDTLAKRVAFRCSNPGHRQLTSGPRSDPTKAINIGVAAHITAASPGGARYDASLTADQRQSIDNGIWLCQNCGKLIDNDESHFTVALLRDWRAQAEAAARKEIESPRPAGRQVSEDLVAAYFDLAEKLEQYIDSNSYGSGFIGTYPAIDPGHPVHNAVVRVEQFFPPKKWLPPAGRVLWIRLLQASRARVEESYEPGQAATIFLNWIREQIEQI